MSTLKQLYGTFCLLTSALLFATSHALLVRRQSSGDIFQNLGGTAGNCQQRGAACSAENIGDLDESCNEGLTGGVGSCPSCECPGGWRYGEGRDICEAGICPEETGYDFLNTRQQAANGVQLSLAVNITFTCSGLVRAWKYRLLTPTNQTSFYLQVWKHVGEHEVERVGASKIDVQEDSTFGERDVIQPLEEGERIMVEPGYFIALYAPQTSAEVPVASRMFSPTSNAAFQSEVYLFATTTDLQSANLLLRNGYSSNAVANVGAITGYLEGEVQCVMVPASDPSDGPSIPMIDDISVKGSTRLAPESTVVPSATYALPLASPSEQVSSISVNTISPSFTRSTSLASPTESERAHFSTCSQCYPLQTTTLYSQTENSKVANKNPEASDLPPPSSSQLNPVSLALITICCSTLITVVVILLTVCILWHRRQRRRSTKSASGMRTRPKSLVEPNEQHSTSVSGESEMESSQTLMIQPSKEEPYYHVLTETTTHTEGSRRPTLSIHIHYDPTSHLQNTASEEIFHIVVPTKDERSRAVDERYFGEGPNTDEECIISLRQTQASVQYFHESHTYWAPADDEEDLYSQLAQNKYREILRKYIRMDGQIMGVGHFGAVQKATWYTKEGPVKVAVKMLKSNVPQEDKVKFLQEAAIMGQFSHENILRLYGVVTVGEPVIIILELMPKGDLRNHLLTLQDNLGQPESHQYPYRFLQFSRQVAAGMDYLSRKGYVHRDLAARNILLDEDLHCKIGDFGMARDLHDDDYYCVHGGPVPVKWTSPEAISNQKFTSSSDVWSYGVVLYEIWSIGTKPFTTLTNLEVIAAVKEGRRLSPPPGCSEEMYQLMLNCWHPDPTKRPPFSVICEELSVDDESLLTWQEYCWDPIPSPPGNETQQNKRLSVCSGQTQYTTLLNQQQLKI